MVLDRNLRGFKIKKNIDWRERFLVLYDYITKRALIKHIVSSTVLNTFNILSYLILIAILEGIKYIQVTKEILKHRVSGKARSLNSDSTSYNLKQYTTITVKPNMRVG